jgi:LysR family nitrogen assimilation transcriptional regulator
MIDLRRLRYFIEIAQAGAISRAAARLEIAQSALSHQVAALEEELGVRLLVRRARGVHLTEAGERFLGHARGVLRAVEQAEHDVRSLSRDASGPVAVGLSHTAIEAVAGPLMSRMTAQAPRVALRVAEGLSTTLRQWILSGEIDIALGFLDCADSRIESVALLEEELVCVGLPRFFARGAREIGLDALRRLPLILPARSAALPALLGDSPTRDALAASVRFEVESLSALKAAVRLGLGCTLLSRPVVAREVADGEFLAPRVVEPTLARTLYLLTSRLRMESRAVAETRRHLADALNEVRASGGWPSRALPGLARIRRPLPARPSRQQNASIVAS